MTPKSISNFIFNVKTYKKIFKPLKKINKQDYNFIIKLITQGADIKRTPKPPPKAHPNYPVKDKSLIEKVTTKFLKHIHLGQIDGPYDTKNQPKFDYPIHTSPISVKLKSSGKAMMLIDESAPLEHSINSEIKPEDKRVLYTTFLELCKLLKRVGPKGWLWALQHDVVQFRHLFSQVSQIDRLEKTLQSVNKFHC